MHNKAIRILRLYLLILFFIIIGCSHKRYKEISIEEFTAYQDTITVRSIIKESDLYWIIDPFSSKLYSLKMNNTELDDTELIEYQGRGKGPGELISPNKILKLNDEIIVSDSGNNRINIYNVNGKFLRSFKVKGPIVDAEVCGPNIYITPSIDEEKLLDVYEITTGKFISSIVNVPFNYSGKDEMLKFFLRTGVITMGENNNIIYFARSLFQEAIYKINIKQEAIINNYIGNKYPAPDIRKMSSRKGPGAFIVDSDIDFEENKLFVLGIKNDTNIAKEIKIYDTKLNLISYVEINYSNIEEKQEEQIGFSCFEIINNYIFFFDIVYSGKMYISKFRENF